MERLFDVVTCSRCGFCSLTLALTRCECGEVLGESRLTHDEITKRWADFASTRVHRITTK